MHFTIKKIIIKRFNKTKKMKRKDSEYKEEKHLGYIIKSLFTNYHIDFPLSEWVF